MKTLSLLHLAAGLALWMPCANAVAPSITNHADTTSVMANLPMGEVVVQAERRPSVPLQVPTSVTSLRMAGTSAGTAGIRSLLHAVPSLYLQESGMRITSPIYIRGVGSTAGSPPVGFYVDGAPLLDRDAFHLPMVDVEQVDVLRGPQTTLYGRNSIIGQVNVRSRRPSAEPGGRIGVSTGNHGMWSTLGVGNLPLRAWRNRLVIYAASDQGYVRNRYPGNDGFASRTYLARYMGSTRWGDAWSALAGITASYGDDHGYAYHAVDSLRARPYEVNYNSPARLIRRRVLAFARIERTGKYIHAEGEVSYAMNNDSQRYDADFTHYDIFDNSRKHRQHTFTGELIVRGQALSQLSYIAGAFGFMRRSHLAYLAHFGKDRALLLKQGAKVVSQMDYQHLGRDAGAAAFGQVDWQEPYSKIRISLGIRGEWERTALRYHETLTTPSNYEMEWGEQNDSRTYNALLPKLALLRSWDNQVSIYGSISKGYKPGGYNAINNEPLAQNPDLSYGAETLWSYEVGLKFRSRTGRYHLSLAAYLMDWHNQQIFTLGRMGPAIKNAGDIRSVGGEVEGAVRLTSWLKFSGAIGYNRARTTRHINPNVVGKQGVFAPDLTASGTLAYQQTLFPAYGITLGAQLNYSGYGRQYFDELNALGQGYHGVWNGEVRLMYRAYTLSAWMRNALNARYFSYLFRSPVGEALPAYAKSGQLASPRTMGLSLLVEL